MQKFMLLFRNVSGDGQYITTPEDMQEDMPRWQEWIGGIAQQGNLVSTEPIEYTGAVVSNHGVSSEPYKEVKELVAGYLICKAGDIHEAVELSKTCPILKYPHGSVEVRAIMPFEV
jgi:hypothetical protein